MPEYSIKTEIELDCHVGDDDNLGTYDLVMGRDALNELKIKLDFENKVISWEDEDLPMKDSNSIINMNKSKMLNMFMTVIESEAVRNATERTTRILDAKYEKADLKELVDQECRHLNNKEKEKLLKLLLEYETLFDGTLGNFRTSPVSLEVKPGEQPTHSKAFPIPKVHEETLKKEIQQLVDIGVLKKCSNSTWASPTSIIPKKN